MKTTLMIAAGLAMLSVAACNKPADETAMPANDTATAAGDTAMDASTSASGSSTRGAMAPSSGGGSNARGGMMTGASGSQTMDPAGTASANSGAMMAGPTPTTQETVAATRGTLSPGGASSGATAPAPKQ